MVGDLGLFMCSHWVSSLEPVDYGAFKHFCTLQREKNILFIYFLFLRLGLTV